MYRESPINCDLGIRKASDRTLLARRDQSPSLNGRRLGAHQDLMTASASFVAPSPTMAGCDVGFAKEYTS